MRYYFIVNPVSGSGRGERAFQEARMLLDAAGADYGWAVSGKAGEPFMLAKAALDAGERCIVAVGGDGTTQEVAAALKGSDAVMGLLPFGTGNDFARAAGLHKDVNAAVRTLLDANIRNIDTGEANGRLFMNVAGFGFDVDVVLYTEKYKKKYNGMLPYMLGILQAALHLKRRRVTLTLPDGSVRNTTALLVNACNGVCFAGGIKLAPNASAFDGLLDVCIVKGISLPQFLWLLPRYVKGKHLNSPHIEYFKAERLEVQSDPDSLLDLDGELIGETPASFLAHKGALKFIVGDAADGAQA